MTEVYDAFYTEQAVTNRIINGAAFSLVLPTSRLDRGAYSAFGMALDPLGAYALDGGISIRIEMLWHFFTSRKLHESAFYEEQPIHNILGQLSHYATTKVDITIADGHKVNVGPGNLERLQHLMDAEFASMFVMPTCTADPNVEGARRNSSFLPVLHATEQHKLITTSPGYDPPRSDLRNILRGRDFAAIAGKMPNKEAPPMQSIDNIIYWLRDNLKFRLDGLFKTPRLSGASYHRMAMNHSTLCRWFDNTVIPNSNFKFDPQVTIGVNPSPFNLSLQKITGAVAKMGVGKAAPQTPKPTPKPYSRFKRERDL